MNTHRDPNRPLNRQIGVVVDDEQRRALQEVARTQDLSVSQFVRRAIVKALAEQRGSTAPQCVRTA